ncbi:MAG: hypothetical protein Q4C04_07940, partial [Clostridia bacterium]|nr:hypothetical protein [Clostridia bacterium]
HRLRFLAFAPAINCKTSDLYSLKFVTYFNEGLRPTSTEFVEWLRAVQEANSLFYSAPSGSQS